MADYTKKEKELKKAEEEDIKDIKEDIIGKLCYAHIRGIFLNIYIQINHRF